MCNRNGHFLYECKARQTALAEEDVNTRYGGNITQFDEQGSFYGYMFKTGQNRDRNSRSQNNHGRAQVASIQEVEEPDTSENQHNNNINVCGHCSILTPSITASTAILSSSCENQLCYPPRMPVCQGKVNGQVVTLLRDTWCSGVVITQELVKPGQ